MQYTNIMINSLGHIKLKDSYNEEETYTEIADDQDYNLVKIPNFSHECLRFQISSAAAAALANDLVSNLQKPVLSSQIDKTKV